MLDDRDATSTHEPNFSPQELRELLAQRFNLSELSTLCHDLSLTPADLTTQGTNVDLARELVGYFQRRQQLAGLIAAVSRARPDVIPTPRDAPPQPVRQRIFISYKRDVTPDEPLARALAAALGAQHDVFTDQELLVGERWVERIHAELRRSDALVVLLSPQAVGSEMLKEEITTAHTLAQVQGGRPRILPVRVAFREPLPYPLSAYLNALNWALWRGPEDTAALVAQLQRALNGTPLPLGASNQPPAAPPMPPTAEIPQPPPFAQLEAPEGTMDVESAFYVERAADRIALDAVVRSGVTLTIKGPRQMGKSSLLMRAMNTAAETGKQVAFLDFQFVEQEALASAERFFRQFCVWLSDSLSVPDRTTEFWSLPLGNPQRTTNYISRHVLKEVSGTVMLAMDEVDKVFNAEFRSDFFGMLRGWHNMRAFQPLWKRLDLALITSTEPYQLIENLNQSPFNVGTVVELEDFTPAQVHDLNRRHGGVLDAPGEARLLMLLGGQPYLTRRALYLMASGRMAAADLFARATDERGPFGDHLRYHLFRLHDRPELVRGMLQAIRAGVCDSELIFFRLRGAGLVRREGPSVRPRCTLYADFFREHLQ